MYYGWVLVVTLGVTETISWGILYYAFAVYLAPMQAELGWSPQVGFNEGIEKTVAWYLSHSEWVESVLGGHYQGERLGILAEAG